MPEVLTDIAKAHQAIHLYNEYLKNDAAYMREASMSPEIWAALKQPEGEKNPVRKWPSQPTHPVQLEQEMLAAVKGGEEGFNRHVQLVQEQEEIKFNYIPTYRPSANPVATDEEAKQFAKQASQLQLPEHPYEWAHIAHRKALIDKVQDNEAKQDELRGQLFSAYREVKGKEMDAMMQFHLDRAARLQGRMNFLGYLEKELSVEVGPKLVPPENARTLPESLRQSLQPSDDEVGYLQPDYTPPVPKQNPLYRI